MRARYSLLHILALPLLACGGGGDSDVDSSIHGIDGHNGSGSGSGSGSSNDCTASSSYASVAFGSANSQAEDFAASGSGSDATAHQQLLEGPLNSAAPVDAFQLILFADFGGFGSGDIKNGTYTITGDDAAFSTCGICAVIGTDLTQTGSGSNAEVNVTDFYTATSGTITLTSVTGTLAGSVSNLQFHHVTTDSGNGFSQPGDDVADSCTASIPALTFSTPLTAESGFAPTAVHLHPYSKR